MVSEPFTVQRRPESTHAVRMMFDSIAGTYDRLNSILSFGVHRLWEQKLVDLVPAAPQGICLDLCTGTGALIPRLSTKFAQVVGADISPGMLAVARARHGSMHTVLWQEEDAQSLSFCNDMFDAVTVAYGVRNLPDPVQGLREMLRVTRPGGRLAVLEFGQPGNRVWSAAFRMYSRIVMPVVGGWVSGNRAAYTYLPATSAAFPCGKAFEELETQAGWKPEKTIPLFGGIAYLYSALKVA